MKLVGELIPEFIEFLVPNKVYFMEVHSEGYLSYLKVKIVNNRNNDVYLGCLYADGCFFPSSVYKHLVDTIYAYHKIGCKIIIIVNPDVIEGSIF